MRSELGHEKTTTMLFLLGAVVFKLLASGITIYSLTAGTAFELAPASSILISKFGVVSASVVVNVMWLCAVAGSLYIIQRKVGDPKTKRLAWELALIFIIGITAVDGLWDLGVLLEFNDLYVISVVVLTVAGTSIYALKRFRASGLRPKPFPE